MVVRKKEDPWEGIWRGIFISILIPLIGVPFALLEALPVMLAVGVLHAIVGIPAIGYWSAVILMYAFSLVVMIIKSRGVGTH